MYVEVSIERMLLIRSFRKAILFYRFGIAYWNIFPIFKCSLKIYLFLLSSKKAYTECPNRSTLQSRQNLTPCFAFSDIALAPSVNSIE